MERRDLREGMKVFASDGESLGKVVEIGADTFIIEKGFFFPKEHTARRDQIADLRDGEVWLAQDARTLREGYIPEGRGERLSSTEELRVPLAEERIEAEKREHQAGEVRVRKGVVTEEESFTVPVRREEVHVERVPASGEATEATFAEGEMRVPIREEVVEVHKRPVVTEEVRVSKDVREDEARISERKRKETAEIEKEGRVARTEEHHRNP